MMRRNTFRSSAFFGICLQISGIAIAQTPSSGAPGSDFVDCADAAQTGLPLDLSKPSWDVMTVVRQAQLQGQNPDPKKTRALAGAKNPLMLQLNKPDDNGHGWDVRLYMHRNFFKAKYAF